MKPVAVKQHTLDIYDAHLYLVTAKRDWAALRRKLTFLGTTPNSAGLTSFSVWEPNGGGRTVAHVVVWIDTTAHPADIALVNTAAHEAAHAAAFILGWVEHAPSFDADEPHAYLVGWLAQWIFDGVRDATR